MRSIFILQIIKHICAITKYFFIVPNSTIENMLYNMFLNLRLQSIKIQGDITVIYRFSLTFS